jgi:hypothetical protein
MAIRHSLPALVALVLAGCEMPRLDGEIAVWTDTPGGGALAVSIDAQPAGSLSDFIRAGRPSCGTGPGVLVRRVPAGVRQVGASDSAGRSWKGEVRVPLHGCVLVRLAPPGAPRNGHDIPADSIG